MIASDGIIFYVSLEALSAARRACRASNGLKAGAGAGGAASLLSGRLLL